MTAKAETKIHSETARRPVAKVLFYCPGRPQRLSDETDSHEITRLYTDWGDVGGTVFCSKHTRHIPPTEITSLE